MFRSPCFLVVLATFLSCKKEAPEPPSILPVLWDREAEVPGNRYRPYAPMYHDDKVAFLSTISLTTTFLWQVYDANNGALLHSLGDSIETFPSTYYVWSTLQAKDKVLIAEGSEVSCHNFDQTEALWTHDFSMQISKASIVDGYYYALLESANSAKVVRLALDGSGPADTLWSVPNREFWYQDFLVIEDTLIIAKLDTQRRLVLESWNAKGDTLIWQAGGQYRGRLANFLGAEALFSDGRYLLAAVDKWLFCYDLNSGDLYWSRHYVNPQDGLIVHFQEDQLTVISAGGSAKRHDLRGGDLLAYGPNVGSLNGYGGYAYHSNHLYFMADYNTPRLIRYNLNEKTWKVYEYNDLPIGERSGIAIDSVNNRAFVNDQYSRLAIRLED